MRRKQTPDTRPKWHELKDEPPDAHCGFVMLEHSDRMPLWFEDPLYFKRERRNKEK